MSGHHRMRKNWLPTGTSPSSHKPSQNTPSPTAPPSRSAQRSSSAQPKSHHEMSPLNQTKPTQRRHSLSPTLRKQLLKNHRLSQSLPANRCKRHQTLSLSNGNRDQMSLHNRAHHRWSSLLRSHHQPDFLKSLLNSLRGPHQQPLQPLKRHPIHRCPSRQSLQSPYARLLSLTSTPTHRTAWCSLHQSPQPYLPSTWTTTNSRRSSSLMRTKLIHKQPPQRHQPRQPRCHAHFLSHRSAHQVEMSGG